jgi:hypothetical protein
MVAESRYWASDRRGVRGSVGDGWGVESAEVGAREVGGKRTDGEMVALGNSGEGLESG